MLGDGLPPLAEAADGGEELLVLLVRPACGLPAGLLPAGLLRRRRQRASARAPAPSSGPRAAGGRRRGDLRGRRMSSWTTAARALPRRHRHRGAPAATAAAAASSPRAGWPPAG